MNMLDWPLFRHPPTAHLYVYCLLRALDREAGLDDGQLTFSRSKAAKATGLSEQEIRTAIFKLSQSGAIRVYFDATKPYSIITVCDLDTCKAIADLGHRAINQPPTNLQPTSGPQKTTQNQGRSTNLRAARVPTVYRRLCHGLEAGARAGLPVGQGRRSLRSRGMAGDQAGPCRRAAGRRGVHGLHRAVLCRPHDD